ncbi:hypothetical protein [Lysobacter antibioticus]|uniref:hypothetical protein n=1 Tax=Lysobacter antibioticus TaxID=84531 RepID=UPI0007165FF5|nr:hypothetical protein [Lysobacter antibioticus]
MSQREPNLSIAGRLLFFEVVLGIVLMFVLGQFGLPGEPVLVGVWLFNLITATYLFKAAKAQGKSAVFYGLVSVFGPPGSLFSFFRLHSNAVWAGLGKV